MHLHLRLKQEKILPNYAALKLGKDEDITTEILGKICQALIYKMIVWPIVRHRETERLRLMK